LGIGVVANQANVVIRVSAMASLELIDDHAKILLSEERKFPIRPVSGHGATGMNVLNQGAPTLGNDVGAI